MPNEGRGWAYSNGCSFEFAVAADAGVATLDHEGQRLDVTTAAAQVRAAIGDVEEMGFEASGLRENLSRIESVAGSQAPAPASRRATT